MNEITADITNDVPLVVRHQPVVSDHGSLEARKAFNAAFAAAQGEYEPIVKNRSVTIKPRESAAYSFRYADLQEIQAKTRPALSRHGLSTTSQMIPAETGVHLVVILMHAEGFERVSEVFINYGDDVKQFGAKCKYMRRYITTGLLDVDADDDLDENGQEGEGAGGAAGNVATGKPAAAPRPARKSAQASAPAQAPADEMPPIDEAELAGRAQVRTENAAASRQLQNQQAGQAEAPASAPAVHAADNPATGAQQEPERPQEDDDTGELAEQGEINFLLKRAKSRGADMAVVLADLGLTFLNAGTLANLTKKQWHLIKAKV